MSNYRQRVIFKTPVLVWKCVHGVAPAYFSELCLPVEDVCVVARGLGLYQLDASSFQECRPQLVSGTSGSMDPLYGTVCLLPCAQQLITVRVSKTVENVFILGR